jgi:VWFA-related protein
LAAPLPGQFPGHAPVQPPNIQTPAPKAPAAQSPTQQQSTIRVSVRRVIVDVTVTDDQGKPVAGLTEQDFRVREDNTPQTVRSFDVHTVEPQRYIPPPKLPPNTFSNLATGPVGGPPTVILLDLLNTPIDAQPYARAQLVDYLKDRKSAGQIAIFVLTDKLHMLQGFTDDDNRLIAALNPQKTLHRSGLLQTPEEQTQAADQLAQTEGNQNGADAALGSFQSIAGMLEHMDTVQTSYLLDRRVDVTAEALQEIARFLAALPGRKNLVWLSAAFPAGILPNPGINGQDPITGRDAFGADRNYSDNIKQATDMLNQSRVAVYPVDTRGLDGNPMFSAASRQTFEPGSGKDLQAVHTFSQTLAAEHATMDTIGETTGGRAFYNTNGLKQAMAQAAAEGSLYYTLSYQPTNRAADGRQRRIRVDLTRPGYHLAYRQTYFADSATQTPAANEKPSVERTDDAFAQSLAHGTPLSHELFFEANLVRDGAPALATPEQMATLMKFPALFTGNKRKAAQELGKPLMLQRYVVQFILLPRQVNTLMGNDDARRDHLEFAIVSYNQDGLMLNGTRTELEDVIKPERWAEMLESGYHIPMAVLIPVDAESIRLGVRDVSDNRFGSIEIPLPLPPTLEPRATQGAAPQTPGKQ